MMKRFALLLLMTMNVFVLFAQNHFVYVRYSPKDGNVSPVISAIEQIQNQAYGQVAIFVSKASTPFIVTTEKEWSEARENLLGMQVEYDYYPQEEASLLNTYFAQFFKETVSPSLHITGDDDRSWTVTFIVSESMLQSSEFEYVAENICVNELLDRMDVEILTYNDDSSLSSANIPESKLFLYNN
ncbi:MAG: hypothetical protein J6A35_03005 [Paludibacteraceae bacterium]|nr:hypothetical protein [Paludibacteraceae bacterium]